MNILVLGDSDTSGRFAGGQSWPELLKASMETSGTEPVTVAKAGLSVVGDGAPAHARKKVSEADPDVVILTLGTFAFTAKFTWLRVQQLFGKRAGARYRTLEEKFDRRTRDDSSGQTSRFNGISRRAVRRALPGKTYSSREAITTRYREVFRILATFEDKRVLVMRYPNTTTYPKRSKMPAERRRFIADMRATAESLHFGWIETEGEFVGVEATTLKSDPIHFNSGGHVLIAKAIEAALQRPVA